ncbi:restriction endonuclease subunit S [Larkinella sp. C7]|uniref:restriction endonuclease subunit S n=1 Tax=Larkinella sp. C7 TaxID=2576607 RepID=UPI0011115C88|nr:restriction endonuclease subunit S [Larkinella sp. C7]
MTKTVSLGEICVKIISGGTPSTEKPEFWGGNIPWITSADIKDHYTAKARKFLTEKAGVDILPAGNILVVTRVGLGKLVVNQQPLAFSQDLQGLILKPNVDRNYLVYVLSQRVKRFKEISRGATIKGVTRDDLVKIKLPLPSLARQRQIAAILDRADALRQKDRQLLEYYEQLAQSTFLNLFGDPMNNEKGWERVKIRDLVREVKYGTSKPAEDKGSFPYLRMNNITYEGHWNFTDLKYINLTKAEEPKYLLQKGDLVFNRTNSKELVGKTAVYQLDDQMAIAGYLIRSRVNEKAIPEYISAYLNSKHGKATLRGMCKNIIGMANINAQELQEIDILQPPLLLQQHFATIIERIERQKAVVRQQMAASEALFQRLLQDSFGD